MTETWLRTQPRILALPQEVLQHVINCLIDTVTINKRTGYQYPYYSRPYRQAHQESRRNLLHLTLSCRRLNIVATPLLYRNVLLTKSAESDEVDLAEETRPDRGALTLALFLQTMLAQPALRNHVRHLDCWFFFARILDMLGTDIPDSTIRMLQAQEWEYFKTASSCAQSEHDRAVLAHVGLNDELPVDALERVFAAILCLIHGLQTVSFPPPPGKKWCLNGFRDGSDDEESFNLYLDAARYDTLSSLLQLAYQDRLLSSTTLQNLEAVRFTFVPEFSPINSRGHTYSINPDPSVPLNPEYSFHIDACIGILQAPKVQEFEMDSANGTRASELTHDFCLADLKIKRAFFTSAAETQQVLDDACRNWSLTVLAIGEANVASYEDLSDMSPAEGAPEIDVWDTALTKCAKTLKVLDIGSFNPFGNLQHLSCLDRLVALEHLRIGLPLLNTNQGFVTRPLADILPRRLKTLTINDSFAAHFYNECFLQEESPDEGETMADKKPRRYRRLLSLALRKFSRVCGETHPELRSIMVFGLPPVDGPRYQSTIRALELAGPQPGQVIVDMDHVRNLFAESGVAIQEFFHGQEDDYRFREVHVARYA
ncbi:hypothetical protein BKA56DRAFT_574358 [Ilyonectria sp. MPI-CAGE-AT-0026]|nr:hypothetical protein BKA56DRAFT_574358 [Ilyonectria sp. MPI-CAGE-AT-0026]